MLNFLPRIPYSMVGIVPDDIDAKRFPRLKAGVRTRYRLARRRSRRETFTSGC